MNGRGDSLGLVASGLLMLGAAPAALGQLDVHDVILRQVPSPTGTGTIIQTGSVDDETGQAAFPERVFVAEFDPELRFTNEPGFDTEEGAFPVGSVIGFDIMRALRVWNGSDFATPAAGSLRVRLGGLTADAPLFPEDGPVGGFGLSVDDAGRWHRHLGFLLLPPAEPGVSLLELQLWSSAAGIARSESIWLVMGLEADPAEILAAADWVREQHVGGGCPADYNGDGAVDPDDLGDFINCYFALPACGGADFNGDGAVDPDDLGDFINTYFAGCP